MNSLNNMERQLDDRIETYSALIEGNCKCGNLVIRVLNSSITTRKTLDRYHYPGQTNAYDIFRCKKCLGVIHESFQELKN